MPPTVNLSPDFQPKDNQVGGQQPDVPSVARPFLDHVFNWAAPLHEGGSLLTPSRCRLRIFRNGALGRPTEWAVLITELPTLPDEDLAFIDRGGVVYAPDHNPGLPARNSLGEIADQVKHGYLLRAPHDQIGWFHHITNQTSHDRPLPHDVIHRVKFNTHTAGGKVIYLNFALLPVPPEELELAAGGMVQL